jgi:hypothetical protein
MTQPRREVDLALEPLGTKHDGYIRIEDLNGNITIVRNVPRQVHGCHTALADLTFDEVLVAYGGPELLYQ